MQKQKNKSAFTLIELLIAIAILSILAAAALILINPLKRQAQTRDNIRKHDINLLYRAIETYKASEGQYPQTTTTYGESGQAPFWTYCSSTFASGANKDLTGTNGYIPNLSPDYIKELPLDPKRKNNRAAEMTNPNESKIVPPSTTNANSTFCYYYQSNGVDFKVSAICAAEDISAPPGDTFYRGTNGWSCGDWSYAKWTPGAADW